MLVELSLQLQKTRKSKKSVELTAAIRRIGFNPENLRHVDDFNMTHPDSFRTLTPEESSLQPAPGEDTQ